MELSCKAAAIEATDWFAGMTGVYGDTTSQHVLLCEGGDENFMHKTVGRMFPHHYDT